VEGIFATWDFLEEEADGKRRGNTKIMMQNFEWKRRRK